MRISIRSILVVFLFTSSLGFSQKFDEKQFVAYKAKYPDEQAIFLKYYQDVDIKIDGDSLKVNSHYTRETLHLGTQSNVYAKDGIYSSSLYEIQNISAKTLVPEKKKYKSIPVTEFKESYDKNSSVFYDDSKYINFFYPAVQPGARTVLKYQHKLNEARFLSSFLVQNYLPVEHSRYSITVDKGIELRLEVLNDLEGQVRQSKTDTGDRIIYTFEAFGVDNLKVEDKAPPIRHTAPHIMPFIKSFTTNGKTTNVMSSPADLYSWYSTWIDGLKEANHENIKAILNELIEPNDTEIEKVKKVFYWVQENIKYIAFEDGMRGFIPHNASYVCDKRYGDCKDMATIVVNMLHEAGIDAYHTWIGTRDIPYSYTEYASPMVDNHMIATYINDDQYYFLDATSQYSSFQLPSAMIQGKEALIALDKDKFEIKQVPEIGKEINLRKDTSYYTLMDGQVKGSGTLTLHGYPKVYNSYKLDKTSKIATDKYVTKLLGRGSNKFFVDNYSIKNLENLDSPIQINYDFRVEDYYREIGNKVYFNMNMEKVFSDRLIEEDREQPVEHNFKTLKASTSLLKLPDNYIVNRLPKNRSFSNDVVGFNIEYTLEENSVLLNRTFYVNTLLVMPEDFEKWNEAIKELNDAYRDIIILENTKT